jgi:putative MATE family efflux protein
MKETKDKKKPDLRNIAKVAEKIEIGLDRIGEAEAEEVIEVATRNPENKMGTLPVGKLILAMSLPPMVSMLVAALYNVVDSIFVARVSEEALAAVTLVFPVQMLMMSFNGGIGVGLASIISRRLGEKRQEEADLAAAHGFFLGLILWILYAVFGIFLAKPFLGLFMDGAESPEIFGMAVTYCRIVMIGSGFFCFSVIIERILQSTGNVLHPMIYNIVGCAVNTVLAPIFIIGLYGAPALGVAGAGYVAVFGQMISFVIAAILFLRKKQAVRVRFRGFRAHGSVLRDILAVGAPSIVMMAVQPILISGLNGILISYSTAAVAVLGVYFRISTFVILPIVGLNQGTLPIMGYNFGAKNRIRLTSAYSKCLRVAFIIMIVGTALFWIFPDWIMQLFSAKGEMLDMGVHALRTISISWVPGAFVIVNIALFQALGHGIFALIISVVRQLGLILPLAYILALAYGINAVWYAYPLAEISAFTLAVIFYWRVRKKEIAFLPDGAV